jgi:hypothetical protein
LTVAPALVRISRNTSHAMVYSLEFEAIARATQRFSLGGSVRIGRQAGTLDGLPETIPYRSVALKLLVTAWN